MSKKQGGLPVMTCTAQVANIPLTYISSVLFLCFLIAGSLTMPGADMGSETLTREIVYSPIFCSGTLSLIVSNHALN
jgi:hypothetical protein